MGHLDQRRRPARARRVRFLCRAVPQPVRPGAAGRPALRLRRDPDLDAADGERSAPAALPQSPAQRGNGAMTTGLQLVVLAGGMVGLGVTLIALRLVPADPDLADALDRL